MTPDELVALARRRQELLDELNRVTEQLQAGAVEAVAAGTPKFYLARDLGVTRATLDKWLKS